MREDVVGRDREMGYVESVVIGKRRSDGRHAVWYGIDWTRHPDAGDRSRGYTLQQGAYDLTRAGADREAADRLRRSTRYGWEKVPSGNAKGKSGKYNGSPRTRTPPTPGGPSAGTPSSRSTTTGESPSSWGGPCTTSSPGATTSPD